MTQDTKSPNIITHSRYVISTKAAKFSHRSVERPDGTARKAATLHTPQIVATVTHHVDCEDTRTRNRFTATFYRWMLITATEYADKQTEKRRQNGRNVHIKSPFSQVSDILLVQTWQKCTVK